MDSYPLLVVMPVAGLAAYCLSHLLICRLRTPDVSYMPLQAGFGCGLLATLGGSCFAVLRMHANPMDAAAWLALNLLTYFALAFGYFNFINLNIASIRIRVLGELLASGGQVPVPTLLAKYSSDQIPAIRLTRLAAGGHLVQKNERFYSGPKWHFLLVARIFDGLHWFIIGARRTDQNKTTAPATVGHEASA